jgi:hypothetical protein
MIEDEQIRREREERQYQLASYLSMLHDLQKNDGYKLFMDRLFAAETSAYRNALDSKDPLEVCKMNGVCFAYENVRMWVAREIAATKQELRTLSIT